MTGKFADWANASAPSLADLEAMAANAYAALPEHFRNLCKGLVIQIDDFPSQDVLETMHCETDFDLLGLFQGVGLTARGEDTSGLLPNMIWLYRRPIIDYWADHDDSLGSIVTHVLVHEIGHHFGLSDDDMQAIEDSLD